MGLDKIFEQIESLKPVLDSAGRSIEIVSSDAPKITFKLSGFCGSCACSSSYEDGLRDLVAEHCPEFAEVEIVNT